MNWLDTLIGSLAPHSCVGCRKEGSLLCGACQQNLPSAAECCFKCLQPITDYRTCLTCYKASGLQTVWRVTPYDAVAKELIWRLKFTGARQAAQAMAQSMATLHRPAHHTYIIPIPTATSRVRQRGYDQATLLAKNYAHLTGQPLSNCLARLGQQHQRGANRQARLQQLDTAYRLKRNAKIQGANILLIDDVATTGASLQAAARVLYRAGAASVNAIVFAQA